MGNDEGRPGYEWNQYKDTFDKDDRIVRSGFNKAWKEQLDKGWTCQKTGAHYVLKERTVRARGFKKCSVCENLEEKMRKAKREGSSPATRLAIREEIEAHLKHIRACRTKYADQNMEAITDPSVASAAMDAAAQRGHRLPMLATEHSKLTGMKKLPQDHGRSHAPTGAEGLLRLRHAAVAEDGSKHVMQHPHGADRVRGAAGQEASVSSN